jgi:hypothetical protein
MERHGAPAIGMRIHVQPGNLITASVGLLFIATGIYGYIDIGRFIDGARPASGTVLEVVYPSANKRGRTHPVVRFTTAEGKEVVVRSEEHHNVQPGDKVDLLYDAANPQQIEITTIERVRNRRLLFTMLSLVFGGFVCFMGLTQNVG